MHVTNRQNDPVRVLYMNPIGRIGGAERMLLASVGAIRGAMPSADVHVILLADGPLREKLCNLGAVVSIIELPGQLHRLGDSPSSSSGKWLERAKLLGRLLLAMPSLRQHLRALRTLVKKFQPTLVHSNGLKTHLLTRLAVDGSVPCFWHLHDFYGSRSVARMLLRFAIRPSVIGIAISDSVAADARRALPHLQTTTILNAVDASRFTADGLRCDLDQAAGQSRDVEPSLRVGLLATYARWKGHATFLEAASLTFRRRPDLKIIWYIIGGPIYHTKAQYDETELREIVRHKGLEGRVTLVPFQDDTAAVYRALDIVVHASTEPEPFGLSIVEGMLSARPVIVSAAGGASELFTPDANAIEVSPGDADA